MQDYSNIHHADQDQTYPEVIQDDFGFEQDESRDDGNKINGEANISESPVDENKNHDEAKTPDFDEEIMLPSYIQRPPSPDKSPLVSAI